MRNLIKSICLFAAVTGWLFVLLLLAHALGAHGLLGPLGTVGGLTGIVTLSFLGVLMAGGLASSTVLAAAMWPAYIERSRAALQAYPLRCWLSGVLAVLVEVFLIRSAGHMRILFILGSVAANLIWLAQGFPALASLAGERLGVLSRPRSVAVGSALVAFSGALPVFGWLMAGNLALQALGAALQPARRAGEGRLAVEVPQ